MDNFLREIESEDVVIYTDQVYSADLLNKCREIHRKLVIEGKMEGEFNSDKWMGYSGVRKYGIKFTMNASLYYKHMGKEFEIPIETMKNMLRCYAIYYNGVYIYNTIARNKIYIIKHFLMRYRDKDFELTTEDIVTVKEFLGFINTPNEQIEKIISYIKLKKCSKTSQRKLSPIINYLVIENEINRIYKEECEEEVFIKWFPIYFWVNVTFILPLRATEMLLTPKNCIERKNNKIFLTVRRTKLKKGNKAVYYDVNKDYKEFVYEIPDTEVVRNIEKYIELTEKEDRRFLFVYSELSIKKMLSLGAFNQLIASFVEKHIIGNHMYDFAKYASGITEYERVTAGDSRPIAMANLYFQKSGADICRQLADHINISTSSGYYTNISDTIWASSIVHLQKQLDYEWRYSAEQYEKSALMVVNMGKSVCTAPKRILDGKNIDDCIEQGHLADCMGCKYYKPTKSELEAFICGQKKKADDSAKRVIEFMNNTMSMKNRKITLEEVFLAVQTDATRLRMGCNIKAREKLEEWQKLKNMTKTSC